MQKGLCEMAVLCLLLLRQKDYLCFFRQNHQVFLTHSLFQAVNKYQQRNL